VQDDSRTDTTLLDCAANGDATAFAVLVKRYIRGATLLAAQLLGDRDDADDIVQDAFTIVHRAAGRFDATRPFAPWFYAIVRRLAANHGARKARRARLLRFWGPQSQEEHHVDGYALIAARLDAEAAQRAMVELSPMQRACFELVALRDIAIADVAAMHGIAESTVRQHVFRARTVLRTALGRVED
jgi:RNA polymerase sigma factor (sigma-70 family)